MSVAFDTLGATKRLRDAGLEERAAEAIVELVQSTAQFPDISGLATKADTATKADLANMATKADLAELAHATRMDTQALKADLAVAKHQILAELNDKLRFQGLALMGGMTAIVGLATAIIKLGS
ncbi:MULTISPECIES: hypothetical protein [Caulobacter]|uniref:DUF1640 domain-containing protein n=1 Tax=Caulobacter rhizosphaerae TaxID=2010972 RepID=A0ABU1MU28_9CAUL|nr:MULTISPECIES: hypothetical protein [Caulobacter]KQZ32089.1 hypothetical protein ASD47_15400 [Caulobacter sp. Root1472]MDR6529692.1 hypothetical protein [Caulobacter rhizosphaerae]